MLSLTITVSRYEFVKKVYPHPTTPWFKLSLTPFSTLLKVYTIKLCETFSSANTVFKNVCSLTLAFKMLRCYFHKNIRDRRICRPHNSVFYLFTWCNGFYGVLFRQRILSYFWVVWILFTPYLDFPFKYDYDGLHYLLCNYHVFWILNSKNKFLH